jgi:small subunit ribosomal protein S10
MAVKSEMRIKLTSYDTMLLEASVKQIIDAVKTTGVEIKGPVPLPTKRLLIAFPRSPHVHKPSFEHFERLTHKRLICLVNPNADVNRALRSIVIPSGVNIDQHSVRSGGKK